jgi:hypothetical protein
VAYAILKGRASHLGVALTVLAAHHDDICRSQIYIHTSIAVNALFTMSTTKTKPSSGQTIEA